MSNFDKYITEAKKLNSELNTNRILSKDRYQKSNPKELQQIKSLIKNLHAVAVNDVGMSPEDTIATIKNIFSDRPQYNDLTINLFKTAYTNTDIAKGLNVHAKKLKKELFSTT